MLGDAAEWSVDTHIAAYAADGVWTLLWAMGGGKKSDRPKPIPRPGEEPEADSTVEKFGAENLTTLDVDAYFARMREDGGD